MMFGFRKRFALLQYSFIGYGKLLKLIENVLRKSFYYHAFLLFSCGKIQYNVRTLLKNNKT